MPSKNHKIYYQPAMYYLMTKSISFTNLQEAISVDELFLKPNGSFTKI